MITTVFVLCLLSIAWTPVNGGRPEPTEKYTVETQFGYEADGSVEIVISRLLTTDAVTFKVQTQDGVGEFDAIAPLDYTALPATPLSFNAGEANTLVTVTLVDDGTTDPGEYFELQLKEFSDGTPAFTAKIFIVDSQAITTVCPGFLWAREHDLEFKLNLRVPRFGPLALGVTTQDIVPADENPYFMFLLYYAFGVTETAVEGEDYTRVFETVSYESGDVEKVVTINITDDVEGEPTKAFYVIITGEKIGTCKFPAVISDDDIPDFFHCGRSGSQPCLNGGICNKIWGICECLDGYGGPDCRLDEEPQDGCDDRCGEHGSCRSTEGEIYCECFLGWAGAFCNYTAFNVQCNKNSFGVCFTPYSYENFEGVIYVRGLRDRPECQLAPARGWPPGEVPEGGIETRPIDNDNVQSWCQGFAMELPFVGPCGVFPTLYKGQLWRHEAQFITQYSKHMYTHLDEWVTLRCEFNGTNLVYEAGIVEVDSSTNFLKKQTTNQQTSPVILTVRTPGYRAGEVIPLGQRIDVCVSVAESNFFDCVLIKRIDVNNAKADPNYETANLYNDGCVDKSMKSVVRKEPAWKIDGVTVMNDTACFTIEPFVFTSDIGQPKIKMGIDIIAILPEECLALTCSPVERKKREVIEQEELSFVLSIDMTTGEIADEVDTIENEVVGGSNSQSAPNTDENSTSNMRPIIIGSAIGGSVFFVAILIALFFFCRRRDPKMHDIY